MYYCKQLSMITKHGSRPVTLQSSCNYENDLAYTLDLPLCRGTQTSVYILFLHTEPSRRLTVRLETRRFPKLYLPHLLALPTGVLHLTNLSFCPMDNTWHARGTGLCPSDPRFTMDLTKPHELQKWPVPTGLRGWSYSSSNMPRISSGAWGWAGCSAGGVGDGGCVAELGMAVSSCVPSSVGTDSGRVGVIVCGSGGMWTSVGADSSGLAAVGSDSVPCSVFVGAL